MAGKQSEQGEGSRESSHLDHFLRRLDTSDAELGTAVQPQASPSNSVAALVSNYDDLSPNPANPWQYLSLSNPPSPISQRDYYNQLSAHSSIYPSGGHYQRDLAAEWMLEELEQQRIASQRVGVSSRAPNSNYQHLPAGPSRGSNSMNQRRGAGGEQVNNPDNSSPQNGVEEAEAFLNEEAIAAWHRMAAPQLEQGLYDNLPRLDSSGMQSSDSASAVDGDARMRWERAVASQYLAASGTGEMDGALPRPSRSPDAGAPGGSTRSANSVGTPNTSLSSGSGGDDSDNEECTRIDPPGSVIDDCNSSGKRKSPEPSGEEGKDDSARTSSEAELKKRAPSL